MRRRPKSSRTNETSPWLRPTMSSSPARIRRILCLLPLCFLWLGLPHVMAQQVATPTFTPDGNYYNLEQSVRIDCATAGATINYTTNGMDPTSSDRTIASGGTVLVDHAVTLKASATKAGLSPSAVKSAAYNIIGKFAAGQNHSLTVKTEGTVWAWGKNANGQLGRGSTSTSPLPVAAQVRTNSTTFLTNAATVTGGASHSAAAKSDGTAWAWGSNASGQIGDGTTTQRLYAVPVKVTGGAALTGVGDVVAGADHCVALKSNGTVWAWGLNSSGQVGIGTTTTPQTNAVQVKINSSTFLTGIVVIAAGGTHSLALKSDGTVWTWGLNSSGQLGNGNTTNQSYAVQVKVVGGAALTGVADIAAGANHSLARKTDGTLWTWGSNANGQLADGTTNPISTSKQQNAVQAKQNATTFLSGVNGIAGGASHSLALKTDGTLWAWGLNSLNQLGDGTATQRVFPVQVKDTSGLFITGVVDFFGGASHSLASRSDGTAWGWGLNSLGQAGSIATGTNPNIATKILTGSSPFLIIVALGDPDGDTLLTWQERELGTNPNLADTDGDTMPDNYEVTNNLNPLVNDAAADPDNDQSTNAQERAAGTNPQNPDTDADQARDGEDIYPLDPHFALKRFSETNYAVVEIVNDAYVERAKLNNLNSVIFSKRIGTYDYMRKSWVWRGGTPTYLMALDEPVPPPDPNTQTDAQKHFVGAADINDGEQIVGWSSYQYPVDFTGFHDVQMYSRLSHAVVGSGGGFRDLGDGTVDNCVYDPTGDPSIDGTNKGQSRALAIGNGGTVAGYADFFVDVAPPQSVGGFSSVISGDSQGAFFGEAPPATRLPAAASGLVVSAINGSGAISGYASEPGGYSTARLWKAGVLLNLGLIPNYPHSGSTFASALNDDHYVAGAQYSFYSGADHSVPYLWHENIVSGGDGKMLQLPMPFNTLLCEVLGMNKDGVMVGYAYSNSGVTTGALWQNGQNFNMTYRLDSVATAGGWGIKKLWDINDRGIIVASAYRPGFSGLVLLVPGRILPDDNQRGITGDLVMSNLGPSGQQHYVSTKESGGFVVLKAVGPDSSNFSANYAWEGDGQAVSGSPEKRQIARDAPGKYQVRLRSLVSNTIVDTMNVWIVWMVITSTDIPTQERFSTYPFTTLDGGYDFAADILPPSILITSSDVPRLDGMNSIPAPGGNHLDGRPLSGGASLKWDISRQTRQWKSVPAGWSDLSFLPPPSLYQDVNDYPLNPVEGNDDAGTGDEDDDPYYAPDQAKLVGHDIVRSGVSNLAGNLGEVIILNIQFREFTRLQMGGRWYAVSDFYPWRFKQQFTKSLASESSVGQDLNGDGDSLDTVEVWRNSSSVKETNNNDW
jgi:alpha-tubulin suppressor-like RCC1 family protein